MSDHCTSIAERPADTATTVTDPTPVGDHLNIGGRLVCPYCHEDADSVWCHREAATEAAWLNRRAPARAAA